MKINNIKIGQKLFGSFIIVIVLFGGIIAYQIYGFYKLQDLQNETTYKYRDSQAIKDIQAALSDEYIIITNAILMQNLTESEAEINKANNNAKKNIETLNRLVDTDEERTQVKEFSNYYSKYLEQFNKGIEILKKRGSAITDIHFLIDQIEEQHVKAKENLMVLNILAATKAEGAHENCNTIIIKIIVISIIIALAGILVSLFFAFIITKGITKPIKKVVDILKFIGKGDFTQRTDVSQEDEIGFVAMTLNETSQLLEDLIFNVINSIQNLSRAIEEIASGNQNLSQRTSGQASSLQEIASIIEETTATIKQNAENAANANKMSEQSSRTAEEGSVVINKAVASINEINQSSKKIREIITMINEISFQTNLLALNAAVEAARAGKQGRGFAVVAGEVRSLAQRSAAAAKRIGALIDESMEKIENGTKLVNSSGETLQLILKSVKDMSKVMGEIAAASIEQKDGINQVNTAINKLDNMTQQNAALVEETSTASEEMTTQAQELIVLTNKFKVRDFMMTADEKDHPDSDKEFQIHTEEKAEDAEDNDRTGKPLKKNDSQESVNLKGNGFEEF